MGHMLFNFLRKEFLEDFSGKREGNKQGSVKGNNINKNQPNKQKAFLHNPGWKLYGSWLIYPGYLKMIHMKRFASGIAPHRCFLVLVLGTGSRALWMLEHALSLIHTLNY